MPSLKDLAALHLTEDQFKLLPRAEQEKYLYLLDQEVQLRKSQKILFYEPNPPKGGFPGFKTFHCSPCPVRAVFGGNRTGKTTCGGIEFLFHITGAYPEWYPKELRYAYPIKGRIGATDYTKGVGEVIVPFLEEWLDMSLVQRKIRNPLGVPVKWILKNGSVFDILTYEQSTETFEGWKGHVAWFDEPPPRDKYIATLRGLVDYKGRCWLTLTPLNQPWIYDEIFTRNEPERIYVVTADIRDNPHLDSSAIASFEKSLSEEEKEARLHGRFMHLTGLVYKEFNADINICEPPDIKPSWTRYMAIDPHERTNTAVLWMAVDNNDNHWVYDELWLGDMDIEQISHAIHAQEGELKPRIRLIDPHNDKENAVAGGFNIRKELMKHGVYCERANSDPSLGKSRIRQALKPKYIPLLKTEAPQLRISRNCKRTIYEFQHYIWKDYKGGKEQFGLKEEVNKKDDHLMDCLRYIYNHGPRYIVPEVEEAEEVQYEGTYTKYPVKQQSSGSYYNLVEPKAGSF